MKKEFITLAIISVAFGFLFIGQSCTKEVIEKAPCECSVDTIQVLDTAQVLDTMSIPQIEMDSIDFTLKFK